MRPSSVWLTTSVTFIESHNAAADGELLARLRVAVAQAARTILADGQAASEHQTWARMALVDPSAQVPKVTWGIVTHQDFISEGGEVSDSDLRNMVLELVPMLVEGI